MRDRNGTALRCGDRLYWLSNPHVRISLIGISGDKLECMARTPSINRNPPKFETVLVDPDTVVLLERNGS